ncbi:hypothetical protein ACJRO7_000267 [Eucalyptus globulus]|uniref:Uncharacterized protein n=1 Tax=Eucalyptus globulus TaxID=34317 RepID=A0ABD3LM44_EUCGL
MKRASLESFVLLICSYRTGPALHAIVESQVIKLIIERPAIIANELEMEAVTEARQGNRAGTYNLKPGRAAKSVKIDHGSVPVERDRSLHHADRS